MTGEEASGTPSQPRHRTVRLITLINRNEDGPGRWFSGYRCFLCKYEDLSSSTQHPRRKLAMAACACNSSTGDQGWVGPESALAGRPAHTRASIECGNLKVKGGRRRNLVSCSGLLMSCSRAGARTTECSGICLPPLTS